MQPRFHIVMFHPEIPHNTGAAGRLALATGSRLHLIKPLGFSLDEKHVRRTGLDYWAKVDLHVWDSLEDRYYEDISRTETDITLRFLEEGDQLDWSRAVRRYHTEDSLLTRSGVDAFLTAVRSGELLSSRISYDERLMVFVEQADGSGGTAVVNPGKGEMVGYLPGDEGEMFVMELTGGVKAALEDSGIDLTRAECYNLCTDGLGWGILYSDGKTELYQPLSEAPAFLEEGTAYTLEELAVDLACQRMTEDELEELKKTQELFAQAIREGDAMRIAQTDERYHEIIYGSTKNEKLVQILNNLREQMYRYRLEYIKDEDKRHILLVEHDQILKALSLRHVHEAKIAIREHIDNQEITILKNLKEQENDVQRKVSGRRNPV